LRADLVASGQFLTGSQLQPIATATTVRVRDGKELVTDGPFAETHEQLGGYFLIEAKNLDEATAIAARIPSARTGSIEVRPLVETAVEATALDFHAKARRRTPRRLCVHLCAFA
jgi:hypothetical protein